MIHVKKAALNGLCGRIFKKLNVNTISFSTIKIVLLYDEKYQDVLIIIMWGEAMVTGLEFNQGLNDIYMMMPLKREANGMKVSANFECPQNKTLLDNLDELRKADKNQDNILSLNELKDFESRTEFMQTILESMENFAKLYK